MTTATTRTLDELSTEYLRWSLAMEANDPSSSEMGQRQFFELQEWGQELEALARANGFTLQQIEGASGCV